MRSSPDRAASNPPWPRRLASRVPSLREVGGLVDHVVDRIGHRIERLLGREPPTRLSPGGGELPRIQIDDDELRIFLVGDWGTGEEGQAIVSSAMTADAAVRKPHLSFNLGDLIYEDGVVRRDDPNLVARVEKPATGIGERMYLMLGNHDHRGNVDAVIAFARDSGVVALPARYYSVGYAFGARTADFFVLDTDVLSEDADQLAWLASALARSQADYRIVLGHHPIHSGGMHGNNEHMERLVLPLIDGHAQLAAAGHDHDQQVLSTPGGTLLLVSGAGGKVRESGITDRTHFASEGLGYSTLTLGPKGLELEIIDAESRSVLYRERLALGERARKPAISPVVKLPWVGAADRRFKPRDA